MRPLVVASALTSFVTPQAVLLRRKTPSTSDRARHSWHADFSTSEHFIFLADDHAAFQRLDKALDKLAKGQEALTPLEPRAAPRLRPESHIRRCRPSVQSPSAARADRRGPPKAKVRRVAAAPPHADARVVSDSPGRISPDP